MKKSLCLLLSIIVFSGFCTTNCFAENNSKKRNRDTSSQYLLKKSRNKQDYREKENNKKMVRYILKNKNGKSMIVY